MKQRQEELNRQRLEAQRLRMLEKERLDRELEGKRLEHMEKVRSMERLTSAERRAREQDQLQWYKNRISIQHKQEELLTLTKTRMGRKVNSMSEQKKAKVEELAQKRAQAAESRQESVRLKSAVRLAEKDRHL
jgi:hypothetical protein